MVVNLDRIRGIRAEKHMTQEQLAKKVGMNRIQYAKRENGIVSFGADELGAVAAALDIDDISIFFTKSFPKENEEKK